MRLALAIGSFLLLVLHGLVFYQQFFPEWERHQISYFEQARGLAGTAAERAAVTGRSPRIEQFIVTGFGDLRVDRCGACHISADDPRFEKYAHPLKTHPYSAAMGDVQKSGRWERRHKFSDFGCTVCHDGQGRGLKPQYSHGEDRYWSEPLLGYVTQPGWRQEFVTRLKGKEYMEANCAQCHSEADFTGTPHVRKGRQLFHSNACYGCHRIEGLSDGTSGPDLTEAGRKFKLDYLWESIADPRANLATSVMPKFSLSDAQIQSLVIFLKSRKGKNFSETEMQRYRAKPAESAEVVQATIKAAAISTAPLVQQGRKLVQDRACLACHKLGVPDGGIAPDLSQEGLVRAEPWLYEHFKNPRAVVAGSIMPAFRFTGDEFKAMSAYLASLKAAPPLTDGADVYKTLCMRCHGEKGDGHGRLAIYLDPYPRGLTKSGFMNSQPRERFIESIRKGVAGASMPPLEKVLNDEQVDGVLAYIETTYTKEARRELKPHNVPASNPVAAGADSIARGEKTFLQRCAGCHGRKADGKGPNSLDLLPRPRNLRNPEFVNSVADSRLFDSILYGVPDTAMPPWSAHGLSNHDAGDLVNLIRGMNQKSKGSQ